MLHAVFLKSVYSQSIAYCKKLAQPTANCYVAPMKSGANTMQTSPITEKPQPPAPNECCESGCDPCVWDIYRAALQQWEQAQQDANTDTTKPAA
jgi:cytochrome-b5 reductase